MVPYLVKTNTFFQRKDSHTQLSTVEHLHNNAYHDQTITNSLGIYLLSVYHFYHHALAHQKYTFRIGDMQRLIVSTSHQNYEKDTKKEIQRSTNHNKSKKNCEQTTQICPKKKREHDHKLGPGKRASPQQF